DTWESFIMRISDLRFSSFAELTSPVFQNILLDFAREIQPYQLGVYKRLLLHRVIFDMNSFIDKRQGFISTPYSVANFINSIIATRMQSQLRVIVELGCGFGLLVAEMAMQWSNA